MISEDRTAPRNESSSPTPSVLDYSGPTPRRPKKTALVMLLIVVLAGVVLVATVVFASFARKGTGCVLPLACASNLRQIGQAMVLYANEHQGVYPPTIEALLEEDITTAVFVSPYTNDTPAAVGPTTRATAANVLAGGHLSYVYIGGVFTGRAAANVVLAYEPLSNHGNGMHVLLGDGSVEWVGATVARRMIVELNAGHNPPRPAVLNPSAPSPTTIPP